MKLNPVDRITGVSSIDFCKKYMQAGKPAIITDFVSSQSPAWKKWNYDYFKELAGERIVNVYGREDDSMDRAASSPVAKMTFAEYLDHIESQPTENRLFLFNLMKIKPELNDDIIYNDLTGGKIIKWLPYMFFGGAGSCTRNHFDIDMSHVFITQYKGIKKIWLFPPNESDLLYKLPFNFHGVVNLKRNTPDQYPAIAKLQGYEAIIHPGETLFMPAGWWHYIQYETEGYSISVRALGNFKQKLQGFRNLVIYKNIDDLMRNWFGKKWFEHKLNKAMRRAERAATKRA